MPVCEVRACEVICQWLPKLVAELKKANELKALDLMTMGNRDSSDIENRLNEIMKKVKIPH